MIRKFALVVAVVVAAATALLAAPASAVVNGTPDEDEHPYVGTLVIEIPSDSDPSTYHYWCSGTMVSPTVFLTAGHCFNPDYLGWVFGEGSHIVGLTLDPEVSGFLDESPSPLYTGTGVQMPGWPGKHWLLDVGAYVLDEVTDIPLPSLPTAGQLDTMRLTGQPATIVGYGMDRDPTRGRNGFTDAPDGIRTYASERVTGVTPTMVHLLGDIAAGGSGPCAGDSGAPRLVDVDGTPMVVAISAWIGPYCQTPEQALRIDTPDILAFIADPLASQE